MKISELIAQLEEIKNKHGDIRVMTFEPASYAIRDFKEARVKEIREKRNREYKTYLRNDWDKEKAIETIVHV